MASDTNGNTGLDLPRMSNVQIAEAVEQGKITGRKAADFLLERATAKLSRQRAKASA